MRMVPEPVGESGLERRRVVHQPNGMEFTTTRLATGLRVHYAEQGNSTGEAIIFLHAYVDSWFTFSRMLPLLSTEYHAFAPDQRGHGDSDKPRCCYTVDDYAADVDAFMEELEIDDATLVGSSSAGMIAQRVALDYPHRVSRLVLIGAPTTLVNNEFVRQFQASTIHHPISEEFLAGLVSESLKVPAHVWHDYWKGLLLTVDDTVRLGEIDAPTLLLSGERDALLPREEQERNSAAIRD